MTSYLWLETQNSGCPEILTIIEDVCEIVWSATLRVTRFCRFGRGSCVALRIIVSYSW